MNFPRWAALAILAALVAVIILAGLAIRPFRRAAARRAVRWDRIEWHPGERAAFRKLRRKYRRSTAVEPYRQDVRWWPW